MQLAFSVYSANVTLDHHGLAFPFASYCRPKEFDENCLKVHTSGQVGWDWVITRIIETVRNFMANDYADSSII